MDLTYLSNAIKPRAIWKIVYKKKEINTIDPH